MQARMKDRTGILRARFERMRLMYRFLALCCVGMQAFCALARDCNALQADRVVSRESFAIFRDEVLFAGPQSADLATFSRPIAAV
jgi:hypothetical protein